MNFDYENMSKKEKEKGRANVNMKYPFVRMKQGLSNKTYFLGKMKKSDKIINNQLDILLYSGFQGTEEDFQNHYGRHKPIKQVKNKSKLRLNRNMMIFPEFISKSIKLTKIKEFNHHSQKIKNSYMNIKSIQNSMINDKEQKEKEIESKYGEIYKEFLKDRSTFYLGSKNNSSVVDTYKNSSNKTSTFLGKSNSKEKENNKVDKIKRIKRIRNLLNEKRNSLIAIENHSFQNENYKTSSIPIIKLGNGLSINNKSKLKTLFFKDKKCKSSKNEDTKTILNVKKVFDKYLKKKKDDQSGLKNVLDPLQKGFKSSLKEVQKLTGDNRENIWMKSSTANLISFGNTFQSMPDDVFYKEHKRIIGRYPDLERAAQILVPVVKIRDNSLKLRMEKNERKIRFICNDNEALMRDINRMHKEYKMATSKSQLSIKHKIPKIKL